MNSIKQIYKIGHGPSSSHTMAPCKAAELFLNKINDKVTKIKINLFNSLAFTGDGHLTISMLKEVFIKYDLVIDKKYDDDKHACYFEFYGLDILNNILFKSSYISIGGGDLVDLDNKCNEQIKSVYPHNTFDDIKKYCNEKKFRLQDYVYAFEDKDIKDFLKNVYKHMVLSIENGLKKTGVLPGDLHVQRKANLLYNKNTKNEAPEVCENRLVSAYAFAVSEENASGGIIVTSPTCGACGILPSVLYYMQNKYKFIDERRIIDALAVAGLIGNIVKTNASISGAVCGCQAEIGTATAMTSAAHATLFKLSIDQIEYAAEIALEHQLGLTCDPIGGYVQIPCIERNAVCAIRAINSCGLAFFLSDTRKVSFDTVVQTMYQTGLDLNQTYKETSKGGLASFYKNRNIESR